MSLGTPARSRPTDEVTGSTWLYVTPCARRCEAPKRNSVTIKAPMKPRMSSASQDFVMRTGCLKRRSAAKYVTPTSAAAAAKSFTYRYAA